MTENHEHDHEHITVVDENGNEELYAVLFSFNSDEFEKSYVLYYPESAEDEEEIELQASSFIENEDGTQGELKPVETEEEWDMIEEVLATFLEDEDAE
ncbi:DUF1292 domain-containing protein [Paenilisteria rocourtiae]|uniref:UPF0473 protein DFP96_104225 n=1 Tax=Listeria rocourtiae TaxID=647910 RepID=A0A4R6ZMD6_9LIST|nr:DUF1292 domain-containing protein [Listeria rocourtiae]EUJ51619.1 hypothetical protein PROCOU_02029 [Listeria rocourtiae FSL F6-920]MBC1434477.1 DUF1292 domain-containing protein [Listeria rocourtiae]MBC1603863.1 DUF1292 domain-containing protein [Listeria rocourtiae]TDR53631.1 uncharacterized protein YrzB (UPF0473 family) [Listeria rocourtiae]